MNKLLLCLALVFQFETLLYAEQKTNDSDGLSRVEMAKNNQRAATKPEPAADALSAEYAETTAYLELVVEAIKASKEKNFSNFEQTLTNYDNARKQAMSFALLLALEGRDETIAIQVTNARIELEKKRMLKEIGYRNENLAILANKHQEKSEKLLEDPPQKLLEVLAKSITEDSNQKVKTREN